MTSREDDDGGGVLSVCIWILWYIIYNIMLRWSQLWHYYFSITRARTKWTLFSSVKFLLFFFAAGMILHVPRFPYYTQQDRRHETTTNRKSDKNWSKQMFVDYQQRFVYANSLKAARERDKSESTGAFSIFICGRAKVELFLTFMPITLSIIGIRGRRADAPSISALEYIFRIYSRPILTSSMVTQKAL